MATNRPIAATSSRPPGTRGSVKGSVVQSRLGFVRQSKNEAAVVRVTQRLPEEDQIILGFTIMPFAWYPFLTNERLDQSIAEEFAMGDQIFPLLGEASALHNLNSSSQLGYIREKNPHALLKQTSAIYRVYYDTGHRSYARVSDGHAVLQTHESESFSRPDCLTVVGWHRKAIELCGGRNVAVRETRCRARGADLCEYVCEWT